MASTGMNRLRRGSGLTNEWPPRQTVDDSWRNGSAIDDSVANSPADYHWNDDERPRRYEGTNFSSYRQGDNSDHELYKVAEEKTSDEGSMTEGEINDNGHGDVRPTHRQCEAAPKKYEKSSREYPSYAYGKAPGSYRTEKYESVDDNERRLNVGAANPAAVAPNSQRNLRDYVNSVNLPQALIAMRKLERLKELQRKRDLSERYYSQEIRRLIGEQFFRENPQVDSNTVKIREKIATTSNRVNNEGITAGETRMRAGGFDKELEPCGTMTTITRLDCGCVKETTRPIFNNSSSTGHVTKCDGHRYKDRTVPTSTSSNPQELTYRSGETFARHSSNSPTRTKGRFVGESGAYQKLPSTVSRDLESWEDPRRASLAQPRIKKSPRHSSPVRTTSPVQECSESSSNSP